jgi:hypothetical protein
MGEVMRGLKGGRRWGAAELTEGGGNDGAMAAVRPAHVDTRPRKDLGATECSGARSRGRTRGKRKGGATTMGHPLWGAAGSGRTGHGRHHAAARRGGGG